MFQRMLASAVFAGFAAGLIAALLQFSFVQKYVVLGELYETGALTHVAGPQQTAVAAAPEAAAEAAHVHTMAADGHDHGPAADAPSGLMRGVWTAVFLVLAHVSYAMMLVAGFGLAESRGQRIGAGQGLLWGLAGFAAFQMAPAMGLAPELPGIAAADLTARQIWWWGTAGATATALALLAYVRQPLAIAVALALLAAPHLIGAPEPGVFSGAAPPEAAAAFAARSLGVGLAVWAALGWIAGRFWSRLAIAPLK